MDLSKLFDLTYLFQVTPGPFRYMPYLIAFFLLLVVGSFYIERWIRKQPNRAILNRTLPNLGKNFRRFGLIGFILLWFRYESIPYLSIRFFLIAYLVLIVAYAGYNIYKYMQIVPEAEKMAKETSNRQKYLPKKKSGKKKKKRK